MQKEAMPAQHVNAQFHCGQCRWFVTGYNGVTCEHKRGVARETRACIEFDPYRPGPFDKILHDKYLRGLQQDVKVYTEEYLLKLGAELKQYRIHKDTSPAYREYGTEVEVLELAQRIETCQAYMDRVLDMQLQMQEKQDELEAMVKKAQSYIFSNYSEQIRNLKNDGERGAFYHATAPFLFEAVDKTESLLKRIEIVQGNLKTSHFSLREVQNAVKLVWESRISTNATRSSTRG